MTKTTNDLSTLEVLDEETLLSALEQRFHNRVYYTYIGDIIVAVNPCQPIDIYGPNYHNLYKNLHIRREQPPHIYWVADQIHRSLVETGQNQCVIVSGESGAGKTESTKHILSHLIRLGSTVYTDLVDQLEKVNPLLELFGNASTVLNKNSSRFCKFIELQYTDDGQLQSGQIQYFILEKSRIIQRHSNEKNFHIFYALLAGMDPKQLQEFHLNDASVYRILKKEDSTIPIYENIEEYSDYTQQFLAMEDALQKIGFIDEEANNMYRVLSAVLNLANITFEMDEETDGVFIPPKSEYLLSTVNELLFINEEEQDDLAESLVSDVINVNGERVRKWKRVTEAKEGRDALAKELYSCLFWCIIDKINLKMKESFTSHSHLRRRPPTINLLDISGFEKLEKNGFEQLLINISNEKLHQLFLQHIIHQEKIEYENEGIEWSKIHFTDNIDVLDLVFQKSGIFSILEEETYVPQSSDKTLVWKLNTFCSQSPRYVKRNENEKAFGIKHYAGEVIYDASGFVEKTRDTLSKPLREIIQYSGNPFLRRYVEAGGYPNTGGGTFKSKADSISRKIARRVQSRLSSDEQGVSKLSESVTKQFQTSLGDLLTKIKQSKLMFVRCLKPNPHLKPEKYDCRCVRAQLQASGLMEAAQVRKDGYPIRLLFENFQNRYGSISNKPLSDNLQYECLKIIKASAIKGYRIGKTKVFLKYQAKEDLEEYKQRKEKEDEEKREMRKEEVLRNDHSKPEYSEYLQSDTESQVSNSTFTTVNNSTVDNRDHKNILFQSSNPIAVPNITSPTEELPELDEMTGKQGDTAQIDANLDRPAFDSFRLTERDLEDNSDFFKQVLKVLRLFFYLFLIVGILGGGALSKLALLMLATKKDKTEDKNASYVAMLTISLSIPICLMWFISIAKTTFRRKTRSSWAIIAGICVLESLQTIGLSLLVFLVIPALGFFRSIILMLAVCQVPATLQFLGNFYSPQIIKAPKRVVCYIVGTLLVLIQFGAIFAFIFTDFLTSLIYTPLQKLETKWWLIPITLLLISLSWWENFALFNIKICKTTIRLIKWRNDMAKSKEATYLIAGPIKFGILLLMVSQLTGFKLFAVGSQDETSHIETYGLMYIQIFGGILCTYFAGLACKLHMQRFSFALPLVLVAPLTAALAILQCSYGFFPKKIFFGDFGCMEVESKSIKTLIIIGVTLWISCCVLTYYVWFPNCERMALLERLFVLPNIDAVFTDLSLLLRRRNDSMENYLLKSHEKMTKNIVEDDVKPLVYVCATTWHETEQEMIQILKSLFRLDFDWRSSLHVENKFGLKNPDAFDIEIHVIFDDAWEKHVKNGQRVVNDYVKMLLSVLKDAASSVAKGPISIEAPKKINTAYGAQLHWKMPGGTPMIVHLKDKAKIRHRKRWSQVMYLYYLLGYKLFGKKGKEADLMKESGSNIENCWSKSKRKRKQFRPFSTFLNKLSAEDVKKAENTFLLTLDGDVDFKPDAVKLLIDTMKKNKKVGAVCGRIHPIGQGPMVWYQQFEYAIGHWLQKAAEHVFGCVLCCPGCFSLFRGSALIDDNVIKAYTKKPMEARDFIQLEQGEDRWLCTLLLQQGYKIDYCAGADAFTFAPETFHDFFIQRRRWAPSTIANIMDLLSTWRITVKMNDNISILYMAYQFVLMASSILAPATVVLMIAGSYNAVLKISMWPAFAMSIIPVISYILFCLKAKNDLQINVAAVLTALYTVVMVIVTVGTIINIIDEDLLSPNVLFLGGLSIIFSLCGILHPKEIACLVYGVLYFITVPSSFIFLTVYFLCNLNIVSWGTREAPKKLTPEDEQKQVEEKNQKKKKSSIFNMLGIKSIIEDLRVFIFQVLGKESSLNNDAKNTENIKKATESSNTLNIPEVKVNNQTVLPQATIEKEAVILDDKYWMSEPEFEHGTEKMLSEEEEFFWIYIIRKYLHPLKEDKNHQLKIKEDLKKVRNNVVFGYFLLNLLWSVAVMQLHTMKDELKDFLIIGKYEPISVMFLSVFGVVIMLQFIGMLVHRWGTFLHLMSSTRIDWFISKSADDEFAVALQEARTLQSVDPQPDYDDEEEEEDELEDDLDESITSDGSSYPPQDYSSDKESDSSAEPVSQYERIFNHRFKTMQRQYQKNGAAMTARRIFRNESHYGQVRRDLYKKTFGRQQTMFSNPPIQNV